MTIVTFNCDARGGLRDKNRFQGGRRADSASDAIAAFAHSVSDVMVKRVDAVHSYVCVAEKVGSIVEQAHVTQHFKLFLPARLAWKQRPPDRPAGHGDMESAQPLHTA